MAQWLRYGTLALPLALGAAWGGFWLADRLRLAQGRASGLFGRAALVGAAFVGLMALSTALLAASGVGVVPAPRHPARGLADAGLAAVLHLAVDSALGLLVAVPLAAVVLGLLTREGRASVARLPQGGPRPRWAEGLARGSLAAAVVLPAVGLATALPGGTLAAQGQTRVYYVAADEVDWNYAPSEINRITGLPFNKSAETWVEGGPDRIGRVYRKALYREYTDGSFTSLKPRPPEWEHLGALGPVIYASVGDTIEFVFKNQTQYPFSVHAHGVLYTKANEGAPYNDGTSGADKADDAIAPGATYTYRWQVPERAGPGPADASSVLWMYHSHVGEVTDTNSGLVGPLVITRRETARPDGRPADVDREFFTFFNVYNENLSIYLDHNIRTFAGRPNSVKKDDEEFQAANLKHTINGFLFGTLPGLAMRQGERVRWYTFALGSEEGIHSTHWHGVAGLWHGMRMDGLDLMPMSMKVLDMVADAPGTWLYHCHVNDHLIGGMQALFTIVP
jgi:FtsP/CotA-like multicopper oxidase with cupredoxin domain